MATTLLFLSSFIGVSNNSLKASDSGGLISEMGLFSCIVIGYDVGATLTQKILGTQSPIN
jgi:hypothetical protein